MSSPTSMAQVFLMSTFLNGSFPSRASLPKTSNLSRGRRRILSTTVVHRRESSSAGSEVEPGEGGDHGGGETRVEG